MFPSSHHPHPKTLCCGMFLTASQDEVFTLLCFSIFDLYLFLSICKLPYSSYSLNIMRMGESCFKISDGKQQQQEDHSWVSAMMEEELDNDELLSLSSSSIGDSSSSTSSFDTTDDATSVSSSADHDSTPSSYELSELMAQFPIKRGLSKFYQGKSESYTSLSMVTSIEDLAKKESPYRRKMMKACKSYGGGLDTYRSHTLPKPIISKKSSTRRVSSFPSFLISSTRQSFAKPPSPLLPVQENL